MEARKPDNVEEITQLTVKQAGARGGSRTLERHGREHFQAIGRKGGKRTAKLYRELYSKTEACQEKSCQIGVKQLRWSSKMEQIRPESRFFRVAAKRSYLSPHHHSFRSQSISSS